jgi:hypothetical protein
MSAHIDHAPALDADCDTCHVLMTGMLFSDHAVVDPADAPDLNFAPQYGPDD